MKIFLSLSCAVALCASSVSAVNFELVAKLLLKGEVMGEKKFDKLTDRTDAPLEWRHEPLNILLEAMAIDDQLVSIDVTLQHLNDKNEVFRSIPKIQQVAWGQPLVMERHNDRFEVVANKIKEN